MSAVPHSAAPLTLPAALADALWAHALREAPRECVGALGGHAQEQGALALALYPLPNVSPKPESEYLADPGRLLRAMRAMQNEGFTLVALYHSHPRGPALPSRTDTLLAAYPVPYLIADLQNRELRAYHLPEGTTIPVVVGER